MEIVIALGVLAMIIFGVVVPIVSGLVSAGKTVAEKVQETKKNREVGRIPDVANDDESQRRRSCNRATTPQITEEWSTEWDQFRYRRRRYSYTRSHSPLEDWKQEALNRTIRYPDGPPKLQSPQYTPLHSPQILATKHTGPHLDDLLALRTHSSAEIENRKKPPYPIDKPAYGFPNRPDRPMQPENKETGFERSQRNQRSLEEMERDVKDYKEWAAQLHRDRIAYWEHRKAQYDKLYAASVEEWEKRSSEWESVAEADANAHERLCEDYRRRTTASSLTDYIGASLEFGVAWPRWCLPKYELQYETDSKILVVDVTVPDITKLEISKTRKLKSGDKYVPATKAETKEFRNTVFFLIPIRIGVEIAKADSANRIQLVCVNGKVGHVDAATGRQKVSTVLSVAAEPSKFRELNLRALDPKTCFKSLKGVAANNLTDLVPVAPIVHFSQEDGRFIDGKEVLEEASETNLAAMDWQDFEFLIRELLEKEFAVEGAEVKVTQASRDRGVDAVIFDPDPLRGGKIVVQAKRYTNVVDVSAVRDLYGTVMNEGAMKGILVTTSNYGKDSYDFASDKPLTLLNGSNLLHLLQRHGYSARIDIAEAKKLLG